MYSCSLSATPVICWPQVYVSYSDVVSTTILLATACSWAINDGFLRRKDKHFQQWFQRPQAVSEGNQATVSRNLAQRINEVGAELVILWGSQSGTAEGFANRLARELHLKLNLCSLVADLSDYDAETIAEIPSTRLVVFILSTYGEGDPSDNATEFWTWLGQTDLRLSNLSYTALGLGNSNYQYYNKVVDFITAKINNLGATTFLPTARADDAIVNATEETFLDWKETVVGLLAQKLGKEVQQKPYEPTLKIIQDDSLDIIDLHLGEPVGRTKVKSTMSASAIAALQVVDRYTLAQASKPTFHLDLDLSQHTHLKYRTGDHLSVYATNSPGEVERLLAVLDMQAAKDRPLLISAAASSQSMEPLIPSPTSLQALLTSYLDIGAPISRDIIGHLLYFAQSTPVIDYLRRLMDKTAWHDFVLDNHINLGRLLQLANQVDPAHNWHHLPLSFIVESLRPMMPRHYSISSSAIVSPKKLSITVGVSSTQLRSNKNYLISGLCSSFLSTINPITAPTLYASISRSTFKLPVSAASPLVLVGAGTGIAPLRAFLHERAALTRMGREVGHILLFYGCRRPDEDYLYREEINELLAGDLKGRLDVVTAFSRENKDRKIYIQDRISEPRWGKQVCELVVEQNGSVYICGSTSMAKSAGDSITAVVSAHSSQPIVDGAAWRDERRRIGKWKEDVWG